MIYHYISLLSKIKKKAVTNQRKPIYNKYNNYIKYIQTISTSTMSNPLAFEQFRENISFLSHLGESKVLYLIYFLL